MAASNVASHCHRAGLQDDIEPGKRKQRQARPSPPRLSVPHSCQKTHIFALALYCDIRSITFLGATQYVNGVQVLTWQLQHPCYERFGKAREVPIKLARYQKSFHQ